MFTVSRSKAGTALAVAVILGVAAFGGETGRVVRADSAAVTIKGFQFNPDPVSVSAGSSITWTNQDPVTHTVVSDDNAWTGLNLSNGSSGTVTFSTPGTFRYACTIHPQIRGTVIVTVAAAAATAAPTAATTPPPGNSPAVAGVSRVKAGTNLIGVPAGTIVNATAIYTFNPDTNDYRQLASDEQTRAGAGYWAMFDADGTIVMTPGSIVPVNIAAAANKWQLIGNPSGALPALISGADAVYTYDVGTGQYSVATTLQPGEGAWAISVRGGTITVFPGATTPVATAVPTVAATAQPTRTASPVTAQPVATAQPVMTPYVPPNRY